MEPSSSTARIEELLTHADWVRALARNLSRDAADADDLSQETWLAALRGAPRSPGRAWLGGVTRNLSRMHWRSSARRTRREEVAAEIQGPPSIPDEIVGRMEMQRLLADAVLRLDEPWRSTVVRRYLDGLSSAEIARRDGVPAATVRGRLKTGLERLRVDLDARHGDARTRWLVMLAPVLGISSDEVLRLAGKGAVGSGTATAAIGAVAVAVAALVVWMVARDVGPDSTSGAAPAAPIGVPPAPADGMEDPAVEAPTDPAGRHDDDATAPTNHVAAPREYEHEATPSGMVHVPAGTAVIGTTRPELRALLAGRARQIQADFAFEAPQHRVEMVPFFMDRYEVTNAQYLLFMKSTATVTFNTDEASLANLEEVAGHLLGQPRARWGRDEYAWAQLYESNKETLWETMAKVVVKGADGEVDEKATKEAFRHAPLVRGMELVFYDRKPPQTWPGMEPPGIFLDYPVRSVSYDDAEAYAEWAGKHVPTEQEWEYAARGPAGHVFPWGDAWFDDVSRANWGAKNVDAQFKPCTMPVDTLPEGRSWCGVHHMLGNAGEWTSSWFGPYPGNEREHVSMGEFVKVIRGATFVDLEHLVLRLAARNWIGGGLEAPPRPGNRFEYIGFRCAWNEQPGLDQLGPIVRRVSRGRRVTSRTVVLDRYAAAGATHFAPRGTQLENHVYVQGKAHSIVLIPLESMLRPDQQSTRIDSRKALDRLSARADDPLPIAVLHTTLPLDDVFVRPGMQQGTCLPGTYVLGVWHSRLCLCTDSVEFVCFLTQELPSIRQLDVLDGSEGALEPARLDLDVEADRITLGFELPIGGASNRARYMLVVDGLVLRPREGALAAAGTWRVHSGDDD